MIRSETQAADPTGKTILTTLSAQNLNLNLNRNLNLNPAQYRPIFPGRAAAAAPPNSKATEPNRNLTGLSEATTRCLPKCSSGSTKLDQTRPNSTKLEFKPQPERQQT